MEDRLRRRPSKKYRRYRVEEMCTREPEDDDNFMLAFICRDTGKWVKGVSYITVEDCINAFIKCGGGMWHDRVNGQYAYRLVDKKTKEVIMSNRELHNLLD